MAFARARWIASQATSIPTTRWPCAARSSACSPVPHPASRTVASGGPNAPLSASRTTAGWGLPRSQVGTPPSAYAVSHAPLTGRASGPVDPCGARGHRGGHRRHRGDCDNGPRTAADDRRPGGRGPLRAQHSRSLLESCRASPDPAPGRAALPVPWSGSAAPRAPWLPGGPAPGSGRAPRLRPGPAAPAGPRGSAPARPGGSAPARPRRPHCGRRHPSCVASPGSAPSGPLRRNRRVARAAGDGRGTRVRRRAGRIACHAPGSPPRPAPRATRRSPRQAPSPGREPAAAAAPATAGDAPIRAARPPSHGRLGPPSPCACPAKVRRTTRASGRARRRDEVGETR